MLQQAGICLFGIYKITFSTVIILDKIQNIPIYGVYITTCYARVDSD